MTQPNDYVREVSSLRDRVADLQEELRSMRQQFAPNLPLPKAWGLSPCDRRLIGSLCVAPNGFRSKEALAKVASASWQERSPKLVEVRIHQLRRKIADNNIGIEIHTVHGEGYAMPKESREIVRRAIAEAA